MRPRSPVRIRNRPLLHLLVGYVVYAFVTAFFICTINKMISCSTDQAKPTYRSVSRSNEGLHTHLKFNVSQNTLDSKPVYEEGLISYPLSSDLRNTATFERFQKRKKILDRACSVAREVLGAKEISHDQRVALQHVISNTEEKLTVESKYCIPRLADKLQKQEHFYNDTFKFAVCLPTKTGCTNWQRGLVSLVKMGEKSPEELTQGEVYYDLDRFPKIGMTAERNIRGSDQGYLTMINVRHPLSRLLSAWRDKFRKGHPWMKIIEPKFGEVLEKLERKNMTNETYAYSFEAFLELAAASGKDCTFLDFRNTRFLDYDSKPT